MPEYPYKTTITMPLHFFRPLSGKYTIHDDGAMYDTRTSEVSFVMDASDQGSFQRFLESAAAGGRGRDIEIDIGADSHFFPFGPDKGDSGVFGVHILSESPSGQLHSPWMWWQTSVTVALLSAPTYLLPAEIDDGSLGVGNVSGVMYPQDGFDVSIDYARKSVLTLGSIAYAVDWGSGADRHEARMKINGNHSKIAEVVYELTNAVRGNQFSLNAEANYYPFGRQHPDTGTFVVQLIEPAIEVEHFGHDQFSVQFGVNLITPPAA